jgi:putative lipoprotein
MASMPSLPLLAVPLCLASLAPLSARAAVTELPVNDRWFARDKALHFGVSAGLAGAGYVGGALLFESPGARWLTGAGVALSAGVAKELYDAGRGSFFSGKDLTWDVLGTATGLTLSWAVDRLVLQHPAPAGTSALRGAGPALPASPRLTLAVSPRVGPHPQAVSGNDRSVPVMLFLLGGW